MMNAARLYVALQGAALAEIAHQNASRYARDRNRIVRSNGFALASSALQVYGGHDYIHDNGIEQCVRDSRIAMLYEGTSEIQVVDLVMSKIIADKGVTQRVSLAFARAHALRAMVSVKRRISMSCRNWRSFTKGSCCQRRLFASS